MAQKFEDEFMDIQSDIISLCLELVGDKVNKIYAYGSIEKQRTTFTVFFEVNGEAKHMHEVAADDDAEWQLLRLCRADLEKIESLCKSHEQRVPTELKMVYDCVSGKYDAKYQYEPVCCGDTEIDPSEIFIAWFEEVQKSTQVMNQPKGVNQPKGLKVREWFKKRR